MNGLHWYRMNGYETDERRRRVIGARILTLDPTSASSSAVSAGRYMEMEALAVYTLSAPAMT